MNACSEPISWLRLERYQLSELTGGEGLAVERHLRSCEACRRCLARVEEPLALPELAALPVRAARARASWAGRRVRLTLAGTALAAAAALLLVIRPSGPGVEPTELPRVIAVKGGELALSLVREHAGEVARDTTPVAGGARVKVLNNSPPPQRPVVPRPRLVGVVLQDGQAFFPFSATQLSECGNERALDGAFTLDGGVALVCAIADERAPVSRDALRRQGRAGLPALTVCQTVLPAH